MIHLHVHSRYSLLEGTAGLRQLVGRAVEYGMRALALTDTAGMYGAIPFYKAARDAGINPLLGVQLGPCVLLAKDREGYAQICHVVTAVGLGKVMAEGASVGGNLNAQRWGWEERSSPEGTTHLEPRPRAAGLHTTGLQDWPFPFDDAHLFVMSADRTVLQALVKRGLRPLVAVEHYGGPASRYHAEGMVQFAQRLGLRAVASSPVYFLDPAHYRMHRVLSAIRCNATVDTLPPAAAAHREAWFRAPGHLERLYAEWPELLDGAEWVAEECRLELALGQPLFPSFPLPAGENAFSWLWKKTFEGLKRRDHPLTPAVIARVRYELDTIHDLGFAPYFLIVADIVRFARDRDIPIVGRGSAANSVVAYALGITRVDPLRYDLYFERFMNRARTDCPDIDLDICWRRRDDVIDYVYERYGAEQVAMICTHNTFQARSAVREVAKAHGLTDREIGRVARLLPHYHAGDIRSAVQHIPECRGLDFEAEPLKGILEASEFIDGFPRHLSIHSGGVVIAPERLTHFTPLQRATKGIVITQYDMHPIEDLGLVKMDLLGHRSLTVIQETVQAVRENRGIALDIEAVPDGDPLTAALLRSGHTMACFQIESPAMRALLQKVAACDIHTLIQCVALVRPGASGSGMKQHFIDRHHGREETSFLHPALEAVLGDTHGVMIYQEDVLKVAHAVAGMDLTEADALRRATSKKRSPRAMAKNMKRFIEKAQAQGVSSETAQEIWELISNFAAYAYCKAHAATYGELAYQCAYLKAHFPAEFFAAILSNRGGFYMPPVYLEEAKRLGIEVRPPDVNRSEYNYTPEDDALRVGLVEIRHLSRPAAEALSEARKAGPFQDLADFLARTRIAYADAEALLHAGAFDSLGLPRPGQLWTLKLYQRNRPATTATHTPLFEGLDTNSMPALPDYSPKKRADLEWEALGLMTHGHPLRYYLPLLHSRPLIPSTALARYEGQSVTLAGWLVTERRLATKNGHGVMKFLTLEDTVGVFEALLFSETYQRYGHLLTTHGPYLITGRVQKEHDAYALIAEHVETGMGPGSRPQPRPTHDLRDEPIGHICL